ncbi:MAG: phosphatidylserine decarboxylase family protein [Bacteroidota bacterium]
MKIHKEGYATLGIVFASAVVIIGALFFLLPEHPAYYTSFTFLFVLVFIITLQFFRSPDKRILMDPENVLAPADGKVVVIEETVENEYFKDKRLQVSIFMSPFNVHTNINPVSGIVKFFRYHPGKFLVAWHPKSSTENERTSIVVHTPSHVEILFRQIAGALAKRIVWYVKEGQPVQQGSEFGFIKFGSRVDIFLPIGTKLLVNIGDKTTGGETVIAKIKG